MGWFIIIGSLPIVVLGVLLKDVIERDFRNLWIIGTTLIVLGILLGVADRISCQRPADPPGSPLRDAILMGARPGLRAACRACPVPAPRSRWAGSSATSARRPPATPSCSRSRRCRAPGLFELQEIPDGDNAYGWGPTLVATVVSFLVGYAAIAWLLRYVSTHSYLPFVIYRIVLGGATLLLLTAGVLSP